MLQADLKDKCLRSEKVSLEAEVHGFSKRKSCPGGVLLFEDSGEKRKRPVEVKSRQLKAHEVKLVLDEHEVKLVLDEWARCKQQAISSDGPPPSKNSLLKWARTKLQGPKLQRVQLNRWLKNEQKYIAAASNGVHSTVRRHQAAPRPSGVGHHPEMERELADYIRHAP